jgi:sortase A
MFSPVIPEAQLYLSQLYRDNTPTSQPIAQSKYVDPSLIDQDLEEEVYQDVPEELIGSNYGTDDAFSPVPTQPSVPQNILNPTSPPVRSLPTPTDEPNFFTSILQPFTGSPSNRPIPNQQESTGAQTQTESTVPLRNVLLIPDIGVDGLIYESEDPVVLNYGIWRRPQTSTPDRGGNTVFVAHRYLYTTGINTFYHLPKMEVGDSFYVYWQQKQYTYEVYTVETVLPTEIEIEENTEEPIVTLYTCTPLWTSEYRLVVRAKLIEEPQT